MGFSFQDFFAFDKMITPTIIRLLFIVVIVIEVIVGLIVLSQGGFSFIAGILFIVVGPILTRVYAEILIVVFQMHHRLVNIQELLEDGSPSASHAAPSPPGNLE